MSVKVILFVHKNVKICQLDIVAAVLMVLSHKMVGKFAMILMNVYLVFGLLLDL